MKKEIKALLEQNKGELAINAFCKLTHEKTDAYDYLFVDFYGAERVTEKIESRDWKGIVDEVMERQSAYYAHIAERLNKKLSDGTLFDGYGNPKCTFYDSPLLNAWTAGEEREEEYRKRRESLDAITEKRYLVVSEDRFPSGDVCDLWTEVYDDPEKASFEAEMTWKKYTITRERKHRHVYSAMVTGENLSEYAIDENGEIDWTCWESWDGYEGRFDSNLEKLMEESGDEE